MRIESRRSRFQHTLFRRAANEAKAIARDIVDQTTNLMRKAMKDQFESDVLKFDFWTTIDEDDHPGIDFTYDGAMDMLIDDVNAAMRSLARKAKVFDDWDDGEFIYDVRGTIKRIEIVDYEDDGMGSVDVNVDVSAYFDVQEEAI